MMKNPNSYSKSISKIFSKRFLSLLLVPSFVVLGLFVGGANSATASASSLTTCVTTATGVTRIIAKGECKPKVEKKVFWTTNITPAAPAAPTCATGGPCQVGETGPGGGKVFYVAPKIMAWGRYLEAAPVSWSGSEDDPLAIWCSDTTALLTNLITGDTTTGTATGLGLGAGYGNTQAMLSRCTSGAANLARSYRGGGHDNWSLPSKDELNEMYTTRSTIGGLNESDYWSSTENTAPYAEIRYFGTGYGDYYYKFNSLSIRPIRAF